MFRPNWEPVLDTVAALRTTLRARRGSPEQHVDSPSFHHERFHLRCPCSQLLVDARVRERTLDERVDFALTVVFPHHEVLRQSIT